MKIEPARWYNWNFTVTNGDRTLARLALSGWHERGVITIGDLEHRVYRESFNGDFVIERAGRGLARATKPSVFRQTFIVRHEGKEYTLHRPSMWRRAFVLMDGDRQIGSIAPQSAWTRRATADVPTDWPTALAAFVIWLVIILWKRDSDSAAA